MRQYDIPHPEVLEYGDVRAYIFGQLILAVDENGKVAAVALTPNLIHHRVES